MKYKVTVMETRLYRVDCIVEADTEATRELRIGLHPHASSSSEDL